MNDIGESLQRCPELDREHELADDLACARSDQRRADQHPALSIGDKLERATVKVMNVAARALGHFHEADTIMARNPRRTVKAPRIMEEVYRVMLQGMMARGWQAPRTRVSVGPLRLSWIAVQYAII